VVWSVHKSGETFQAIVVWKHLRRFAINMPHWCFVALLALVCHWLWRQLVRSVLGRGLQPGLSAAPGAFAKLSHGRVHYRRFLPLPQQQQQQQQQKNKQVPPPLVVCVHGFGGNCNVWISSGIVSTFVSHGFQVLTYEHYGHGHSDGPDCTMTGELLCGQLVELLNHIDARDPFVLCGFSMGGGICTLFSDIHPDWVRKLVLVSPAGIAGGNAISRLSSRLVCAIPILNDVVAMLWSFTAQNLPHLIAGGDQRARGTVRALVSLLYNSGRVLGFDGGTGATLTSIGDNRRAQRRLASVLIVWATADRLVYFEGSKEMLKRLGRDVCKLVPVHGAQHLGICSPEFHQQYCDAIIDFVDAKPDNTGSEGKPPMIEIRLCEEPVVTQQRIRRAASRTPSRPPRP
jgi:pimeloyl-ACP methyl ester carboxylesterase